MLGFFRRLVGYYVRISLEDCTRQSFQIYFCASGSVSCLVVQLLHEKDLREISGQLQELVEEIKSTQYPNHQLHRFLREDKIFGYSLPIPTHNLRTG